MAEKKVENTSDSAEVNEGEDKQTAEFLFPLHDIGNAERFVKHHGEYIRFCPELKHWLINNNAHWEMQQSKTKLYLMVKKTIQSIHDEAKREDLSNGQKQDLIKHATASSSKSRMSAMLDLASMEESVQISARDFNSNPWQINCANGTLNLQTK